MKKYLITLPKSYASFLSILFILALVSACGNDDEAPKVNDPIDAVDPDPDPDPDPTPTESLPLMSINTSGIEIPDEPKIIGVLIVEEAGEVTFSGNIGIEIRGSSSQGFPKKGYGFETREDADPEADLDVALLGFPEEEDWVLHGPYSDKSLMRNVLIYDLSRDMNRYASRTKFVELSINGSYRGIYVFMEKLKRDKERIDISKLDDDENTGEDLTGGYVLKVDRSPEGEFNAQNSFTSQYGSELDDTTADVYYVYDYPDWEDITDEQRTYISTYVGDFETALASDNFTDPVDGYAPYIDVASFVDFIILNEVTNNVDAYRLSTFMHKDKNGKLTMGPIWDFNIGFGNADYCGGNETNVWAFEFNERCPGDTLQTAFWWERLMEDPAFVALFKSRWNELRGNVLSEGSMFLKVDDYVDLFDRTGSLDKNYQKWDVLGNYVWPNGYVGQTYTDEINYLKSWISDRLLWMDATIDAL